MTVNQHTWICVLFLRYWNNCEINETINLTDKQEFLFYIYDADGVFRSKNSACYRKFTYCYGI